MHLIYALPVCDLSPEELIAQRLEREYYPLLAEDNEIYAERPSKRQAEYIKTVVCGVAEKRAELDQMIAELSERWSLNRISSLARAILELAMYEALYLDDVPMNVAIHEAVLLAKKYEESETVGYVNGVLGAFSRKQGETPTDEGGSC